MVKYKVDSIKSLVMHAIFNISGYHNIFILSFSLSFLSLNWTRCFNTMCMSNQINSPTHILFGVIFCQAWLPRHTDWVSLAKIALQGH